MGQGCLLARRLVESGVRFISGPGWDHHQEVFNTLSRDNLPEFDRAFGPVEDLAQRGMPENTLTIAGTEFAERPRSMSTLDDHWPTRLSIVVARWRSGRPGHRANRQKLFCGHRTPVHVEEFLATIYVKLGTISRRSIHADWPASEDH
jgi:hypothetical protein